MRVLRALLAALDLVSLARIIAGPEPVLDDLRLLVLAFLALAGLVVVLALAMFGYALVSSRRSSYT